MSADSIARQPAGTPAGGRFAESRRQEAGYVLVMNPPGPETDAKEAVTDAVLALHPDATAWKVASTQYDDGYAYDETNVEATVPGGGRVFVDLSRTGAADALIELAEHDGCGYLSELAVTIPDLTTAPPEPVSVTHPSSARIDMYVGADGAIVVDYDTSGLPEGTRVRVNVNDGVVFDGDPELEGHLQAQVTDQVRMEGTVTGMVQDACPGAGSWRIAVVDTPEGRAMSGFVEVRDTAGAPLGVLDSGANPAVRAAARGLFGHLPAGGVSYRRQLVPDVDTAPEPDDDDVPTNRSHS